MLTTILGGNPRDVRALWESSQGVARPSRLALTDAADNLRHALRGLHLAAGRPAFPKISATTGVPTAVVQRILFGHDIPSWSATAALATGLGADPEAVRSLWEQLDYALITSRGSDAAAPSPHTLAASEKR
ncbi:hypothetical protein I5Q34_32030 [Streptomyces sp. AV19]|nr:hypothetical protein [Streptomyces sp. AV19]MBH1938836.1 hypothetical protein [Streptomyces sp. AV19]MDG4534770.1 hypothetical protein [Streptomyces sp. AV19]